MAKPATCFAIAVLIWLASVVSLLLPYSTSSFRPVKAAAAFAPFRSGTPNVLLGMLCQSHRMVKPAMLWPPVRPDPLPVALLLANPEPVELLADAELVDPLDLKAARMTTSPTTPVRAHADRSNVARLGLHDRSEREVGSLAVLMLIISPPPLVS
jgi:hypothetical protein